jgi:hypothetical protein
MSTNSLYDRTPYLDLPWELRKRIFAAFSTIESAQVFGDVAAMRKGMEELQAALPDVKALQKAKQVPKAFSDALARPLQKSTF